MNKAAVPEHPGVYARVGADGTLRGYGARRPRPGEPGKSVDARQTFASIGAAETWRAEVDGG